MLLGMNAYSLPLPVGRCACRRVPMFRKTVGNCRIFVGSHSWRPRSGQPIFNTFATGTQRKLGGPTTILRQAPVRRGFARGPVEPTTSGRLGSAKAFAQEFVSNCLKLSHVVAKGPAAETALEASVKRIRTEAGAFGRI